ncbi:Lnb N-terminal periplasmic domain-containing protein [Marinomonas epiphytica]
MRPQFIQKWILYCLFFTTFQAYAITEQKLDELASNRTWLDLLHYHQVGLIAPNESQIDDPDFFLSEQGKINPKAELLATINAFEDQASSTSDQVAAQCRYPARFAWLKKQNLELSLPTRHCQEFDDWFGKIDGESLYLIFPAAYLNSPSSMYGHTLLRVKKKGNQSPLLDYAVNYAANADPNDNQLVFSYKGLTGGYPGVISVTPYYEKVKEYNFLESRDIWEYKLDLNQAEVDQFIRHVWEVRNVHIEYYFFSENCSYQLLAMLDASSDRLNTTQNFNFWAIPADTIRQLKEANAIAEVEYRASVINRMNYMLSQLKKTQIDLVKSLVDYEHLNLKPLEAFTPIEQAQILEVAYEYSRYLSARKKSTLSYLNRRSIKLLSLRSHYNEENVFDPLPTPQVRDDQGHSTQRLGLSLGENDHKTFTELEYRPSYHDILDLPGGYLEGAELSMFSSKFGFKKDETVKLNELAFINIRSLAPANPLITPKSWQVNASLTRDFVLDDKLVFRIKGGAGVTYKIGKNLFTMMGNARASASGDYDKGYQIQLGPQLQWLYSGNTHRILTSYQYLGDINKHRNELTISSIEWAMKLNSDWQIRTGYEHQKQSSLSEETSKLTLVHYF